MISSVIIHLLRNDGGRSRILNGVLECWVLRDFPQSTFP